MNKFALEKELEAISKEKKRSEEILRISKDKMAKSLLESLNDVNSIEYNAPVKMKKSFSMKFKEFTNRMKIIFGFNQKT